MSDTGSKVAAGGHGFTAEITVEGLPGLLAALKSFEPDALRRMNKEIRAAARGVRDRATSNFAATGGAPDYVVRSSSRGKKVGVKVVAGGGTGRNGNDWSGGVLGAILEFYGSRTGGRTPRSQSCTATLNQRYGAPGRFLWSAWDSEKASAIPRIEAAVRQAEHTLQARLDSEGIVY